MSIEIEKILQLNKRRELTGVDVESQKFAIVGLIQTMMSLHRANMVNIDKIETGKENLEGNYESYYLFEEGGVKLSIKIITNGHPDLDKKRGSFLQMRDLDKPKNKYDENLNLILSLQTHRDPKYVDDFSAHFLSVYTPRQFELMIKILENSKPVKPINVNIRGRKL